MAFPNGLFACALIVSSIFGKAFEKTQKQLKEIIEGIYTTVPGWTDILLANSDILIKSFDLNGEESKGDLNPKKDTSSLEPNPENEHENTVDSDAETTGCSSGVPLDICGSLVENPKVVSSSTQKDQSTSVEEKEDLKLKKEVQLTPDSRSKVLVSEEESIESASSEDIQNPLQENSKAVDDTTEGPEKKESSIKTESLESGVNTLEEKDSRCENETGDDCNRVTDDKDIGEGLTNTFEEFEIQINTSEASNEHIKKEEQQDQIKSTEKAKTKEVFQRTDYSWDELFFRLILDEDMKNKNEYDFLNIGYGDCVKKLFSPVLAESEMFKNTKTSDELSGVNEKEVFNKDNFQIKDACFTYTYKKQSNFERLDIAFRSENEGWVWRMFAKPNDKNKSFQDLFYREFILEKFFDKNSNEKWRITLGQEGEIKYSDSNVIKVEKAKDFEKIATPYKWINANFRSPCTVSWSRCYDTNWQSLNFYWKPNDNSEKKLGQLLDKAEKQIVRWNNKNTEIYSEKNRKRIYWNGKWYSNLGDYQNKPLIRLRNELRNLKGEWKDLYNICEKSEADFDKKYSMPTEERITYCLVKSQKI